MPEQEHQPVECKAITRAELRAAIETVSLRRGYTADQFIAAVRQGQQFDDPALDRIEILASVLIESTR